MNKKYVSQLYDPSKLKGNRLNVIYAPMGSGKTKLFKDILKKHKCLMIAPYRSSRDDFGLAYNYSKAKGGLNHKFLYTDNLIDAVTKGWANVVNLTSMSAIEKAVNTYINSMLSVTYTHILFDEVDFMWDQVSYSWPINSNIKPPSVEIWEYILKALATKFILIGQTSTRIPTLGILNIGGQLQIGAKTSVRFESITPVLVGKDVTHNQLFRIAMDESMKEIDQPPTLVYKQKFSGSDVSYMNAMVKKGQRILIVMRQENSPKVKGSNNLPIDVLTQIGAIEAMATGISSQATHLHFKIIGKDTALDKITPLADPYAFFDYIFINTSSSRQVSLKAVRGDKSKKVRVITIGGELNSTIHQVAGRFRENRVEIIHYLKGYLQKDTPLYSGMKLWAKLFNIDPVLRSYWKYDEINEPDGSTTWPYIAKQQKRQAKWIGKTVKKKANQKTITRIAVLNKWFKSLSKQDLKKTQKDLLADYQSYCLKLGETPFSKNVFPVKLKEAKATHKP